jgi:uncharacterized protein (UPF0332 family)
MLEVANRAYYACYYCMVVLVYTKNASAKTHQGIITRFSELFIKTKLFPPEISNNIAPIFKFRQVADYDLTTDIAIDKAQELINSAKGFILLTRKYFEEFSIG